MDTLVDLHTHSDVVLPGPHPYAWAGTAAPQVLTTGLLRAMENPLIKGITHPVNAWQSLDVKHIVQQAAATHPAVELNLTKVRGLEQRLRQFLDWGNEFNRTLASVVAFFNIQRADVRARCASSSAVTAEFIA
jgi:hypothetical protein